MSGSAANDMVYVDSAASRQEVDSFVVLAVTN